MKARILGAVAVITLASSCLWDVNEDGRIVVACLGDSNTAPFVGFWCESVAAEHPDITFVNYAVPGARAIGGENDGRAQLARAVAGEKGPAPDFVVLAFLTNDIGGVGAISAEEAVGRVEALVDEAGALGIPAFVATVPPRFLSRPEGSGTCAPNPGATPIIEAANVLLRERISPDWLIDFDSGFTCPEDYHLDGVHISVAGQEKRAARAAEILFAVPE
jgi:lysophospholipase L1-like esterase